MNKLIIIFIAFSFGLNAQMVEIVPDSIYNNLNIVDKGRYEVYLDSVYIDRFDKFKKAQILLENLHQKYPNTPKFISGFRTEIEGGVKYFVDESKLNTSNDVGFYNSNMVDVTAYGILPNDPSIDATLIINEQLIDKDVELFFPKGNYYFSELHITKDNFVMRGDRGTDIAVRTVFHPFNNSQYYIMKLGGGKFTLNDNSKHIQYPIIEHIQFTTPRGYVPKDLTSLVDIEGINYLNSALIIDKVQVGRFAINGNTIHNTPLLSIGFSYELQFDYITMYGNHGKSDLPIIQTVNSFQTGRYLSASIIDKLMVEVFVGPILKTPLRGGINELLISNVFIEGTIEWEAESITSEQRFNRTTKDLPNYYNSGVNLIPMFDIGGVNMIVIDKMFINATDTEWTNSLDPDPTRLNTRSFFNFYLQESEIQINNIIDGAWSSNMLLTGIAPAHLPNRLVIGKTSPNTIFYNQATDLNLVEDKALIIGNELQALAIQDLHTNVIPELEKRIILLDSISKLKIDILEKRIDTILKQN